MTVQEDQKVLKSNQDEFLDKSTDREWTEKDSVYGQTQMGGLAPSIRNDFCVGS